MPALPAAVLASMLLADQTFAAVTPYSWLRLGEQGLMADSTGNNHPFNAAYSSLGSGNSASVIESTGAGGPLGGTGEISAVSTRWGFYNTGNSGMWIEDAGKPPTPEQFSLPAVNWVVECWILPVGTGGSNGRSTSQFLSTGSGQFSGTPGGVAFRTTYIPESQNEEEEIIPDAVEVRLHAIGPAEFIIGDPVAVSRTRWTHLAAVNDNGVTTFYVNGTASGGPATGVTKPSGVPYIGSGQDTNNPYNGYLDEIRFSTFETGAFTVNDLLLRPVGPSILVQPQAATVWAGGPAPFEVQAAIREDTTYQWKLGGVDIPGATGPEVLRPAVTAVNAGEVYSVTVTDPEGAVTSSTARIAVEPQKTENIAYYRSAIQAEAGLLAYFPVDGDAGTVLSNLKNAAASGTLETITSYDGRTNRSYGERALRFKRSIPGIVTVPASPAFEFSTGGTVEAIVYLSEIKSAGNATLFSLSDGPESVYWQIQCSLDGLNLYYDNDSLAQPVSWALPVTLVNRQAHIAVAFAPGTVTAYVDGVSLGTKANPSFGASGGAPLIIGSAGRDFEDLIQASWHGTIDEVAIYNASLSENTIAGHNSRFVFGTATVAPVIEKQPATGTLNLLAGGAPSFRVEVKGTAPLIYQWVLNGVPVADNPTATTANLVLNNSTAAMSGIYTLAVSNEAGNIAGNPITVNFTAPADTYSGYVLADNPSAYWRLDETSGSVLKDSAGGLDGVYSTTVMLASDGAPGVIPDTAVNFPNTTEGAPVSNALVPFSPTLNPSGAFTVECWVNPAVSGQTSYAVLASQNRDTAARPGYVFYQGFDGNFWGMHLGLGASDVIRLGGGPAPLAGRWDHIVATWDGANTSMFYVNGELVDTVEAGPVRTNLSTPLEIGSRFNGQLPYKGTVDEVAFYNRALSLEQIRKHWSISWVPTTVTQQPAAAVNVTEFGNVTITAAATGYPNTFQWLKNGEPLEVSTNPDGSAHYPQGVTSPTLVITQSAPGDTGSYQVVITNPLGNQTTTAAAVTVTADATPPVVTYVTADGSLRRVRVGFDRWVTPETAGVPANYTFGAGITATGVVLTMDPSVVDVITGAPLTPGSSYTLSVSGVRDQRANGNLISSNSTAFNAPVLTQGVLSANFYAGIPGNSVDDLLNDGQFPDGVIHSTTLASFSTSPLTGGDLLNNPEYAALGLGSNYATHVFGWITPAVSGNYTFFIRSDDGSELYLSTDNNPANVGESIAFETGCCDPFKEPAEGVEETSLPIALVAGQSYYIEAYQKEGGGGDFLEVAWRLEGDATPAAQLTPIPAQFLSAYATIPLTGLQTPVLANGQVTLTWGGEGKLQESDDLEAWTDVAGNPASPYTTPAAGRKFYRFVP